MSHCGPLQPQPFCDFCLPNLLVPRGEQAPAPQLWAVAVGAAGLWEIRRVSQTGSVSAYSQLLI